MPAMICSGLVNRGGALVGAGGPQIRSGPHSFVLSGAADFHHRSLGSPGPDVRPVNIPQSTLIARRSISTRFLSSNFARA